MITYVIQFQPLFQAYAAQDQADVWNVHISNQVANPSTRRQLGRGHGKMQAPERPSQAFVA